MGGAADSAGGFLGLSDGPQAPKGNFNNKGLDFLTKQNDLYANPEYANAIQAYMSGNDNYDSALKSSAFSPLEKTEWMNALSTNPISGSKMATDQVGSNAILGGLYGQGGQLSQAEDKLSSLNKQGFNLTPEDHTMYGQMSGNIARQFGQQGNQAASNLASRGLSSSGAAGAMFSGLQGNQNEQLAAAQQQIAQQRYQNTMGQIGQYQNFVNSMGANAGNAINQQFGRQLQGAENQKGSYAQQGSIQSNDNNAQNQYGLQAANFEQANKPKNFMDFATAGAGQGIQSQTAGLVGGPSQQAGGMGGGGGAGGAGAMQGLMSAAPALAAASDERLKENIRSADSEIEEFLNNLGAHSYSYKDSKFGVGRFVSPMAQELEQTEIGRSMVINTPEGKVVDYARGYGAILAAQALINKKLNKLLEGK